METHVLHSVKANTAIIGGLTASGTTVANQVLGRSTSASAYRNFLSLIRQTHGGSFSTLDLKTALDAIGVIGASIGGITGGLVFYFALQEEGGPGFAAGAVHRSITMTKGIVVPTRLNCDDLGDAELSYDATAVWNSAVDPIVLADTASLPTIAIDQNRYSLGPVSLGGLALPQLLNFSVDFGIKVETYREAGGASIYDQSASITQINPKLTLRGNKVKWFGAAPTAIPLAGLEVLHATSSVYLRARDLGGQFISDVTPSHIKLTFSGLATIDAPGSYTHGDSRMPGETTLTIETYHNGTLTPLVIATAVAIT